MSNSNSSALVLVGNEDISKEKKELIRQQCAPGSTDIEMDYFLYFCRKYQLDPLLKQVYFQKRGQGQNAKVSIQIGIDGYRLIAERTGLYAGSDAPKFAYGENKAYPARATVTVYKIVAGQRCPFEGQAHWTEYAVYYGDNLADMWRRMPHNQLAKCAEAQALRKAFPAELAGTYTTEEMEQANDFQTENPSHTAATATPSANRSNGAADQSGRSTRTEDQSIRQADPNVIETTYAPTPEAPPLPTPTPPAQPQTTPPAAAATTTATPAKAAPTVEIPPKVMEAVARFKRAAVALDMPYKGLVQQDRPEWLARLLERESVAIEELSEDDWIEAAEVLESYLKATEEQPHRRGATLVREMCKSALHRFPPSVYKINRREWYALAEYVRKYADKAEQQAEGEKKPNPRARFFAMCHEAGLWQDESQADNQRAWMSAILSQREKREVKVDSRTMLSEYDWRYLADALEHHAADLLSDAAQPPTAAEEEAADYATTQPGPHH